MLHLTGLLCAFVALICWGFGDFFIQRTTRAVGSWKALFYIGVVGLVGLFPFVYKDLPSLSGSDLLLLCFVEVVVIFSALFDFEALRQGKIAIVEPIIGLELPITVGISLTMLNESVSALQLVLIAVIFIGIVLAITKHHTHLHYHKRIFERGVILAGVGAIGMALYNVLIGVASREISPLVTIWFTHSLVAAICFIYLAYKGEVRSIITSFKKYPGPIIGQSLLDNVAWVAFATATTLIPIAIATTISESYVALAVWLGLFVNREKLNVLQIVGVSLATVGVILLSYYS
jgi:drug/metabolite transporter (DMT)-like permease